MSAGIAPEGFNNYVDQIKEVADELLEVIEGYPIKMAAPSLIMAIVLVAAALSEEFGTDFMGHINIMKEGIDALASDVNRQENKHGN